MKKAILSICLLVSSCTTVPKTVNLPIVASPRFIIPNKPKLLTASLTAKSTAIQVEKAHLIDLDAMTTYSDRLLLLLTTIQGNK